MKGTSGIAKRHIRGITDAVSSLYSALTYDWIGMGGGKIIDTEVFENILKRFNSELGVNLTGTKKLSKFLDFNQSEITGSEITGSEITEDGLKKVETEPGVKTNI